MSAEPAATATVAARHREALRLWLASDVLPVPGDAADALALAAAAREQHLAARLHAAVAAAGGAEWPRAVRDGLADEHRRLLVRGVGQLDLAARVDAILAARGLRSLPLKGAALAESLYASVAERPMADVDVLALDDWPSSVRALDEAGFEGADRADHAWSFLDPVTRTLVELHRSVTSCRDVFRLDPDSLWSRARPATGQVRRRPSSEDLLVQIAQHALFQHAGVLWLVQWLDIRRLLERDPPDPERLEQAARAAQATLCVRAALSAAAAIVGSPERPDLLGPPAPARGAAALAGSGATRSARRRHPRAAAAGPAALGAGRGPPMVAGRGNAASSGHRGRGSRSSRCDRDRAPRRRPRAALGQRRPALKAPSP